MKKVIYTCLIGNYDTLKQPLVVDDSFDYICFTDNNEKRNGVWEMRYLSDVAIKDPTRYSRYAKILPHRVLSDYNYSIYVDANIQILTDNFYTIVNKRIEEGELICQVPHLKSNCIYEEIRKAYFAGRVGWKEAKLQYSHLIRNGFPSKYGLFENNIILRKHNDAKVIELSEKWWDEYSHFSKRDQFSLMYVYWRKKYMPSFLFDSAHNTRNVECLEYSNHSKVGVLDHHLSMIDRNNPIRVIGRCFHTFAKNTFIKLYLSKTNKE